MKFLHITILVIFHLVGKGLKALNVWLNNCRKYKLNPKLLCIPCIGSILNYACEISGFSKAKEIERIHMKFCKKILICKMNTPTTAVYGELGRYALYISRHGGKIGCLVLKSYFWL